MPYLPFDLDAKKRVPKVARVLGVSPGDVSWGLLELWEQVWATKRDVVSELDLDGCFPAGEKTRSALENAGFIERTDDGWRVRGAARFLKVSAARAKGAASTNAKRWGSDAERPPVIAPESLERRSSDAQASLPGRSAVALTPSTQHPTTTSPLACAREAEPLVERLCATFQRIRGAAYAVSFADQQALRDLLRKANGVEDEVDRRFGNGLPRTRFPTINTLADLNRHWNACATPETQPGAAPERASVGRTQAPSEPCAACGGKAAGDVWGQALCPRCHAAWNVAAPNPLPDDAAAWTRSWAAQQRRGAA